MPITDGGVPFAPRETSREAAESVTDSVAAIRMRVYRSILGEGMRGRTCDELEIEFARIHETISARVWDLNGGNPNLQKLVVDSGARRQTRRRRRAIVWVAAKVYEDGGEAIPVPPEEPKKPKPRCAHCGQVLRRGVKVASGDERGDSQDDGDVQRLVAEHDGRWK